MSTTRNSAYVIAAQLSLLFSGALINFGLGRFLGPSAYGQFGIVYAIATVINLLLTPGIIQAVSKFVAENKSQAGSIAKSMLKRQLLLGIVLGAVYYLLASPVASVLKDSSLALLLKIQTPLVLIYVLSAVYAGYLAGKGRFGINATELLIYSSSRLIITFALAYFFSLAGAVIALPAAALIGLVYFFFFSKIQESGSYDTKKVYSFAVPITAFIGLIALFLNIDLFLVKALLQDNALVGYYTAAGVVSRIPYFVLSALGIVMLPKVAEKLAAKQSAKKFVQDAFRYVIIILVPAAALIAATGKLLVMLLYRSEYAAAGIPLSILAVGTAALTITYLFAIVVNASGSPAFSAAVAAGMLALSAALSLALIPRYYLVGAATATALTSLLSMIIMFAVVYAKIGNPINYSSLIKVAAASILVFMIAVQVNLQNKFLLPVLYLSLGVLYLLALFVMKEIKREDFKRVLALIPNRLNGFF